MATLVGEDVNVWGAGTGQKKFSVRDNANPRTEPVLAWSANGRLLATRSDSAAKVWDVVTGRLWREFQAASPVQCVAWSPDGTLLAAGGDTVTVWRIDKDFKDPKLIEQGQKEPATAPTLLLEVQAVSPVAFSRDCKRLASGGKDGDVRLWDVDKGEESLVLKGHTSAVTKVVFSSDGTRLAAGWEDGTVWAWDADKGRGPIFKGKTDSVRVVAFSPNGKRLAAWSNRPSVRLWDVDKGQELLVLKSAGSPAHGADFSPDGKLLVTHAGHDGQVQLCDANTGRGLRIVLQGHSKRVVSAAFSPDSKQLSTASLDGTVRLWDVETSRELRRLDGPSTSGFSGIFSPDGKRLATRGQRDTDVPLQLWDIANGQGPHILEGQTGSVSGRGLAFSLNGKRLAAASSLYGTVRIWDVEKLEEPRVLSASSASVYLSPDGKQLATASQGGRVQIWDVDNGRQVFDLKGYTKPGSSFVFYSSDGKRLAAWWQDGTIRVWDLHPSEDAPGLKENPLD